MKEIAALKNALCSFAKLNEEEFNLSSKYWRCRTFKKGEYYNEYGEVCRNLGFVTNGFFRSYTVDVKTSDQKNIFFYPKNGFVVAFKSFINQVPCSCVTQALTDATVV